MTASMVPMMMMTITLRYDETNAMRNTGGGAPPLPKKVMMIMVTIDNKDDDDDDEYRPASWIITKKVRWRGLLQTR